MKSLFITLLLFTAAYAQQTELKPVTGKKVALVIGNDRYAASPLANCVSDASAIAKVLREQLQFDTVLADAASKNLNRLALTRRIQAFQKEAQGAAVALFYYAGHGMEDFDGRDNYLIPVDADLAEAAKDNAGLEAHGIPLGLVLKRMAEATSGAKIILLDCCRERPIDRIVVTRDGGGFVMPVDSDMPQDTLIMLAAAPARAASDGLGHGPFTAALIKHLPAPGAALFQTFRAVRSEVLTTTNQQQKPWLKMDGGGDFFYDHTMIMPEKQQEAESMRRVTKADGQKAHDYLAKTKAALPPPLQTKPKPYTPSLPKDLPGSGYFSNSQLFAQGGYAGYSTAGKTAILKRVQAVLRDSGHHCAVDGVPGPATQTALLAWQRQQGIAVVSGKLDSRTLERMGLTGLADVPVAPATRRETAPEPRRVVPPVANSPSEVPSEEVDRIKRFFEKGM